MEWIRSKISEHPRTFAFGLFGLSLVSFAIYQRMYRRQSEIIKFCRQLGTDIENKLKDNKKIHFMPTNEEVYIDYQFSDKHSKEGFPFTLKWLRSLKDKPVLKSQDFDKKVRKEWWSFCTSSWWRSRDQAWFNKKAFAYT